MKVFLAKIRDITISGILALLPLYVFLLVISKAWKSLSSIGAGIAQMLGMKSVLGVGGASVFSGLLIVAIWLATGMLVRYSFLGAVSKATLRATTECLPVIYALAMDFETVVRRCFQLPTSAAPMPKPNAKKREFKAQFLL
jgi:hypothetical protein